MLKGEYPQACRGCFRLEEKTGHSPRLEYNTRFCEEFQEMLKLTKEDGTLKEARLAYLDVTTDNHCNLKCRMCRPRYSHKIMEDWKSLGWDPGEKEVRGIDIQKSQDIYQHSPLLEESFSHLRMITCTGGEPFLSPAVHTLLNRVIESGHAPNISLRFFTNTTLIPRELESYLKSFKETHLFCSIDGYGKTSDYIRYPSKWATIDRTYRELLKLKEEYPNFTLDLHTVVQAFNITQLIDLFKYLAQFQGKVPILPSFTRVDSSLPLDPALIQPQLLKKAQKDFVHFIEKNQDLLQSSHREFHEREIKNYKALLTDTLTYNRHQEFLDFVIYAKKLDKLRGQSLEQAYPEFKLGHAQ